MAEPKPILIAEIGAAHGVRGEVRVKAHTADPLAVADYGPLSDGKGGVFKVKSLRHLKDDMLVVAFEGVADRTAAEKLNRTKLFVDRSALPPPDEDEFYHADLIGLAVETTAGEAIGTVATVADFGAGDLLEVRRPGKPSVYLPFTRAVVPTLDFAAGKAIVMPPDGLLDEAGQPEDGEDAS
ncbi:ribosome maturation factor RimM [Pleomorphomonas koreensis]|uniref:ribosome maturation factor RimM n=1 Tax=Pleomorphomonas koreensis TaxID=257440 RepID=UPI000428E437|nr:ribosome maturation factor RimM [Pleomorphomonas koreensis]